jgi:hypothetical protein
MGGVDRWHCAPWRADRRFPIRFGPRAPRQCLQALPSYKTDPAGDGRSPLVKAISEKLKMLPKPLFSK